MRTRTFGVVMRLDTVHLDHGRVTRAYRMLLLAKSLWVSPNDIDCLEDSTLDVPDKDLTVEDRQKSAYYKARKHVVDMTYETMDTSSPIYAPQFLESVMLRLGFDSEFWRQTRFYLEPTKSIGAGVDFDLQFAPKIAINGHGQARLHVFYGGRQNPIGAGHSHAILIVNHDWTIASVVRHHRRSEVLEELPSAS